jgi:DNA (cytosine-5)-methyltransferase 1
MLEALSPAGCAVKPPRARRALVADLFCGAGSLSMGATDALLELGYRPEFVAVNHWPVAVETYARNHAGSRVHCVTLDAAFPATLVPEGKLDLLMAGIECTYFSRARGGKPVNDQQRMSAWHVVRWVTELRTGRLLLENVPEFQEWGPVNPRTGKPLKSRKGEYFRSWIEALGNIGFRVDWRVLNCADYGDATTRERLFMMAWQSKKPIPWPHATHTKAGADLFGAAPWRAAREIIDWSIPARSIFDRKRPLAPKTLARIAAGIVKFRWPEPFIVVLRQHCDARGIDLPLPAITAGGTHLGLVQPFTMHLNEQRSLGRRPVSDPLPTITATSADFGLVQPFVATVAHGNSPHERDPDSRRCRSIDDPLQAIHAGGNKFAVVQPFVLSQASGGAPREVGEPLPTMTTGGNGGAHALIAPYYGSGSGETCNSVEEPLPTATAKARFGLVMPVTHACGANRARSVEDPLPTITTARRGELAFITASFGERPTQAPRVHSVEEPAPTICAQGRVNLVTGAERPYDILFRMLEPAELAAAMSISTPEAPYDFAGNKTEVVRQIGQAVPRATGRALVRALMGGEG